MKYLSIGVPHCVDILVPSLHMIRSNKDPYLINTNEQVYSNEYLIPNYNQLPLISLQWISLNYWLLHL